MQVVIYLRKDIKKYNINLMKRICTFLPLISAICLAMVMFGCKADVDLNNIDTTTSIKANLALPIGSVNATLGDFVGDGTWGIYVDSLENRGVLTFKDTFIWERPFHDINLSQYISRQTLSMKVYDKLSHDPYFQGYVMGNDNATILLEFPLVLHLNGINNNEAYERLDSVQIKNASFVSSISTSNLPLEWEWIDKVTIKMGDVFSRKAGNIVTIYEKGVSEPYGYDKEIPINIDEFTMNLMKNDKLDPTNRDHTNLYTNDNVVDTCDFLITMYIKIPSSAGLIEIPKNALFNYNLGVQFIDYHAIWGMFKPSKDMQDENEIILSEAWSGYKTLNNLHLPLADPRVDLNITTKIAGALMLHGEYLYVIGENGEKVNATFDGSNHLYKTFTPDEYLSLKSTPGDSVTMHVLFDKDKSRGQIDKLFTVHPERFGYKYSVDFNSTSQGTPQIRITENTSIRLDAACTVPFIFNEGISLNYADTISGFNLNSITLDSLLANVPIIDTLEETTLKLGLSIENSIPLQFKGVLTCLDSLGSVVMDPNDNTKPFKLTSQDTILIKSPIYEYNKEFATWTSTPDTTAKQIITIEEDMLSTISQIKSIAIDISLDDEALQYAYKQGYFNVKLTEHQGLRLRIGIGADIKALLNLDELNQSTDSVENQL